MSIYLVHATEQMYHGLHGMEDACVVEANDWKELTSMAEQMSIEVMESYEDITDTLLENAREEAEFMGVDEYEESSEFENILNDQYNENVEYSIYQLSDDFTLDQYKEMLSTHSVEKLIEYAVASW